MLKLTIKIPERRHWGSKGGSGPSGLDANGWKRIFISNSFDTAASDLRKSIAGFIKKHYSKRMNFKNQSFEAFIAC